MPATRASVRAARTSIRRMISKAAVLITVGIVFGWVYAWASPKIFPTDVQAGFKLGMAHGALMPMALPSLVLGKDVDIYAANNAGHAYKLGYIVGINICGLVFFGAAFWRPARNSKHALASDLDGVHMNHPR